MIQSTPQQTVPLTIGEQGVVLVAGTRVPLDTVVYAHREGATPEEIVASFTSLDLADVYAVISYALHHEQEVNEYLRQREAAGANLRAQIQRQFPSTGLRDRLLARRAQQE
jgi:uncharacterized protein (DUF433 family)